ncbi:MAG: hypothetical protein AB7D07_10035 [Desulfovibrionaceae bacterium]
MPNQAINPLAAPPPAQFPPVAPHGTAFGGKPMTDILDIKAPVSLPGDVPWLWILLGAAAALLLAAVCWYVWKRKKRPKPGPPAPTPEWLALADLSDLESAGLSAREFYFRLSEIARCYLEQRFGRPMLEMTTEEVLAALPSLKMPSQLSSGLREVLRESDPVRYAGARAAADRMQADLDFIRELVETLAPSPEPESSGEGEDE